MAFGTIGPSPRRARAPDCFSRVQHNNDIAGPNVNESEMHGRRKNVLLGEDVSKKNWLATFYRSKEVKEMEAMVPVACPGSFKG
ncbi:hypothetical protein ZHAS_00012937 [Anopheles sinensis]|uniref:Uncharacterized protein n=1 Tax=Anopheles sinensis TaxID=74873 RepID=A0A084W456_ANOSI|nr:hypothetical protein ZHAS_00012937 [Anopheles sinensis]